MPAVKFPKDKRVALLKRVVVVVNTEWMVSRQTSLSCLEQQADKERLYGIKMQTFFIPLTLLAPLYTL